MNNHKDSSSSVSSLSVFQGAALLTADCLGTGILALPADIIVLGRTMGLFFLLLSIPINLYAGTILSHTALFVEQQQQQQQGDNSNDEGTGTSSIVEQPSCHDQHDHLNHDESSKTTITSWKQRTYQCIIQQQQLQQQQQDHEDMTISVEHFQNEPRAEHSSSLASNDNHDHHRDSNAARTTITTTNTTSASTTFDYISLTQILFPPSHPPHHHFNPLHQYSIMTLLVIAVYYTNLFLVLGDYILVMSHAVRAMVGTTIGGGGGNNNDHATPNDHDPPFLICLPIAGLIASTLMFATVAQLRTMAHLGRAVSYTSLIALFIVVIQCLMGLHQQEEGNTTTMNNNYASTATTDNTSITTTTTLVLSKLSALASIGFATGSQKLLLNIRHDMTQKQKAPRTLAMALTFYVSAYIIICILAGPNPPSFLFDAIAGGGSNHHHHDVGRRIGGFLLWIHVAVSYAINSQAICSRIDRLFFPQQQPQNLLQASTARQSSSSSSSSTSSSLVRRFLSLSPFQHILQHASSDSTYLRWMMLTFGITLSSYMVANAIPFFKDLVSLIGALTSIPLTLLLPAILYRKVHPEIIIRQQQQHSLHQHDSNERLDGDELDDDGNCIHVVQSRWQWWFHKWHHGGSYCSGTCSCSNSGTTWSFALIVFSIVFAIVGLIGALSEIELDWRNQGAPFACS